MQDADNFCKNHRNTRIASMIEVKRGMCLTCIDSMLDEINSTKDENRRLTSDITSLRDENDRLTKNIEHFRKLMVAENEGVAAASNLMPETQNPYPEGDLSVMWINGWQSIETMRSAKKALAVLRWTNETLAHVSELSKGYGNSEISSKIDTILTKIKTLI